jgi:hypothetical protein
VTKVVVAGGGSLLFLLNLQQFTFIEMGGLNSNFEGGVDENCYAMTFGGD